MADPLTVAVDITPALTGGGGIPRYLNQVTAALERRGVEVRRFGVGRASAVPARTRRLRVPARIVHRAWDATGLPRVERIVGRDIDVVHAAFLPVGTRRPVVVTVHDLAPLDHPELHSPRAVHQMERLVGHIQQAAVVVAVSQTTADDLVRHGVSHQRIVVAPHGVTPLPPPPPTNPWTGQRFILAVGQLGPRKGLDVLLHALQRAQLADTRLVLAGAAGPAADELRTLVARLGIANRVDITGFVDDAQLAGLYRDATLLCFPTRAEGFGLPLLEAMDAGLPVVASDLPVVREVTGDAALLVAPGDPQALADALELLVADEQRRNDLAAAGRARAGQFSWDHTAAIHVDAYRTALDSPGTT